ncbi:MAG: glycoside hydrolase family 16 protein [Verrucomicrobia bacterium]|nr:glycoside hydrolase family 16 protein [Verrucomicrobiota bacterium]
MKSLRSMLLTLLLAGPVALAVLADPVPSSGAGATPAGPRPVVAGLDDYRLTFNEEFDKPLSIAGGTGWDGRGITRWICHTPYSGDFGDAWFSGPADGKGPDGKLLSPFSVAGGILTITAWQDPSRQNHWRSGLLSSVDTEGRGFSQAMGYWECRMKCPSGPGVWPAFWLSSVGGIKKGPSAEIDILEAYGVDMTVAHQNVHLWNTAHGLGEGHSTKTADLSADWHVFSCLIDDARIHFYIDANEVWNTPVFPEAKLPLYVMVDLALGGGWPIDKTPSPSRLLVDYVRVYAPRTP